MTALLILSFLIVGFGEPASSTWLSMLSSALGFSLFFYAVRQTRLRFRAGVAWYAAVQAVQLGWMTASTYQGMYIYLVYLGVILWLGIQFGLLVKVIPTEKLTWRAVLGISGMWTLLEWSRLGFLCGLPFSMSGIALTANLYSLQMVSLFGIFGLTFWVMMTNLLGYRALVEKKRWKAWASVACIPYLFGAGHFLYHKEKAASAPQQKVSLIQTGLLPDEKSYFHTNFAAFVPPFQQWVDIVKMIPADPGMIVLPEAAIPYQYSQPIFPLEMVSKALRDRWGAKWLAALPPFKAPYAKMVDGAWYVSHAFWMQALANFYGVEVVGGFEEADAKGAYNAGFHVFPAEERHARYEKQILVPLSEYLPSKTLAKIVANYGIIGEFTHGKTATVSGQRTPLSISICFEECFGNLMRKGKQKGAELYVNLTNDGWFAFSNLHASHFDYGKPRSVENGVPLVRASNTGASAIVDSLGRTIAYAKESYCKEVVSGAFSTYTFATLYSRTGDWVIIFVALFLAAQYCLVLKKHLR